MEIGSKIKKSRIDAKLTQEQAAEALGVGVVGALLSYCSNLTTVKVLTKTTMKKLNSLVCVALLLLSVSLLGACTFNSTRGDVKMQFMRDFNLDIDKDNIKIEELFNNYEGVPYEGIALYKITLDNDAKQDFLKWSILPLSESAELFLTSISDYVELPEIADGYWMLVDRNPGTQKYTNVSFCIYDTAEEVAYMITMDS